MDKILNEDRAKLIKGSHVVVIEPDGMQTARNCFLNELPGLAFAVFTLAWVVDSLSQLTW
jgi:hypothetical protein